MKCIQYLILLICIVNFGCGKKTDSASSDPPAQAALTFPAQNALCTSGTVISATQSSVTFTWAASAATDAYELNIKNLLNNTVTTLTLTINIATVTLQPNTPYSWYVISKSNNTSAAAQSDIWKFYLAGRGIVNYSPFPASITAPAFGLNFSNTTSLINLTWAGTDVDNDIVGYDVCFGTSANPPLLKSNITNMFLNNVPVTAGTKYYWKVITKDMQGNTSDSGIYQFQVN